jgi:MFS family permease
MAASSILLAAFSALVPFVGSGGLPALICLTFLYSTAGGALDLGGNALLVIVWGTDSGAGAAMNLLHFAWGMGSAAAPVIASGIGLSADQLPQIYLTLAAIALLGAGFVLTVPSPSAREAKTDVGGLISDSSSSASSATPSKAAFWRCMIAMFGFYFCYAAAEKVSIHRVQVQPVVQ